MRIKKGFGDYVSDYFGLIILGVVAFFIIYPLLGKSESNLPAEFDDDKKSDDKKKDKDSKKKK